MAFVKVSALLLLLFVVLVATVADARGDLSGVSNDPQYLDTQKIFCSSCECRVEYGIRKCYRSDRKVGGCPVVCGSPCKCNRKEPPTCQCTYEVDACEPETCDSVTTNYMLRAENLLFMKKS